jgi:hypothetical protein
MPDLADTRSDAEHLGQLGVLLAAIARKASTRFGDDPAAVELVELARKAEALVLEMKRARTN